MEAMVPSVLIHLGSKVSFETCRSGHRFDSDILHFTRINVSLNRSFFAYTSGAICLKITILGYKLYHKMITNSFKEALFLSFATNLMVFYYDGISTVTFGKYLMLVLVCIPFIWLFHYIFSILVRKILHG